MRTLNPPAAANKQKGRWFVGLSQQLDALLRFLDLRTRRTLGGWMDRKFKVARHTAAALVLPSILCGLLVLGSPDRYRWLFAAIVALVVGFVLVRLMQWSGRHASSPIVVDLVAQVAVVVIVCGLIWASAPDHLYRDGLPYRHALLPIAVAVGIALLVGATLIGRLFKWPVSVSKYPCYLQDTELFLSAGPAAPLSTWTLLAGSAAVASRAPLALLTVPAIATLVVPPVWIPLVPIVAGAACLVALLLAGLNDRFGSMWLLLQETLSKGGALLVSLVLVVLAVLRLADVSYATTIFDSAAWFDIAIVFVAAYVLSWWFDYWLHRVLTDQLMCLLNGGTSVTAIGYDIDDARVRTSVPARGRRLQVHGAGRLIVICDNPRGGPPYFQAHQPMQLIELLASGGAPGGKAVPTPGQIYGRIAGYKAAAGLVLGGILAWGVWQLHQGRQDPEVELKLTKEGVGLASLLTRPVQGDQPVIVLAASGGGTRAAVYTAAVLEGIARQGKAGNVVLGSGVSGGGAALAYFAGRRADLIAADSGAAWNQYFATITEPFIQDVLQRSTEWRMISSGRLGTLLSESFQRRWNLPVSRQQLSKVEDMGLILNTSLAGHFVRPTSAPTGPALKDIEPDYRRLTTSTLAGGRLMLTNLSFPGSQTGTP
mgnify:CR=1 FL=1